MGSYNETCGLTQLPIEHGDKVAGVLVRDVAGWKPISLPIVGQYSADTGWIESGDETLLKFTPSPPQKWSDVPEWIRDRNVFAPREIVFFHFKAWKKMQRSQSLYYQQVKDTIVSMAVALNAMIEPEPQHGGWVDPRSNSRQPTSKDAYFAAWVDLYYESNLQVDEHLLRQVIEYNGEKEQYINALTEHIVANEYLEAVRRDWSPRAGKGRQTEDYDKHVEIAELSARLARRLQAREQGRTELL